MNFNVGEMKRDQVIMIIAVVALLLAGQRFAMNFIDRNVEELSSVGNDARVLKATVEARSNNVIQYKQAVKIDEKDVPRPAESQNKFYSTLLALLSEQGFAAADVTRASEDANQISFRVTGEAPYGDLLRLLVTFRDGRNLMRVTSLNVDGMRNNIVSYNITVSARIGEVAASAEGEKK